MITKARKIGNQPQKLIKVSFKRKINCIRIKFCIKFAQWLQFFIIFVFSVIQALVALVNDPEPEHPLRGDLAEEFLRDRKKFTKNAEEFTRKNSEKRPPE